MSRTIARKEPAWLTEISAALAANVAGIDPAEWVYGYVRISRDENDRAEGVQLQAKNQITYATRKGLALAQIFCDNDMSGADADRPALREALKLLTRGPAKVILARDVARLTRDYDLGNELMKLGRDQGVRYLFMKDTEFDLTTGVGRKNFMVKVAEAAEYRETNTENLLDRMSAVAAQGAMQGGSRRFGYGKLVGQHPITGDDIVDRNAFRDEEVAALREAGERLINGETQTSIVSDFNRRGITTSGGRRWWIGKLTRLMGLEAYVAYDLGVHTDANGQRCECLNNPEGNGIREHKRTGTRHRAQWPAVFTRAESVAIQAALRANRRGKVKDRPRQRNGEYWLTGLLKCGGTWAESAERAGQACTYWLTGTLVLGSLKDGTPVRKRRYECRKWSARDVECGCGRVFRRAEALELFVAEQVIAAYEDPQILARLDRGNDNIGRIAELERRIEVVAGNLDSEADRRTEVLAGGGDEYDLRVIERTMAGLKQSLKTLNAEQDSLRGAVAVAALADIGTAGDLRKVWEGKGARWRHEATARLVEKIVVRPAVLKGAKWVDQTGKSWRFDSKTVEVIWRDL